MQINISQLEIALQVAPHFVTPEMNRGTSYLFDNVYRRLADGEEVRLSDLDFAAFDSDDINALGNLYNDVFERNSWQVHGIVDELNMIAPTCKAEPFAYI
jgi:hypothetical protein